jgi:hypothetical protein
MGRALLVHLDFQTQETAAFIGPGRRFISPQTRTGREGHASGATGHNSSLFIFYNAHNLGYSGFLNHVWNCVKIRSFLGLYIIT